MVLPREETNNETGKFRKETEAWLVDKDSWFYSGHPDIPHRGATFKSSSLPTLEILRLNAGLDKGNVSIRHRDKPFFTRPSLQEVTLNVSVPSKTTEFCDRDEHSMVIKELMGLFICDGCKQQGSGPRYICNKCNYELHKYCMHPKAITFFDYSDETEFLFFPSPQPSESGGRRWCNACTKQILGFNYQSVDGKLNLHPCCGNLLKKLQIMDIDTLFDLQEKTPAECIGCHENKVSSSPAHIQGLEYASRCGRYHFHVHCMMELLHTNASIKDGNNHLGLEKIELKNLAK